MNTLIYFVKFIIDARIFISISAVALSMSTFRVLGVGINWKVQLLVFVSTLLAYTFPFYLRDETTLRGKKKYLLFYAFLAMIGAYLLSFSMNKATFLFFALASLLTLFYYLPLGRFGTLRQLPYAKIFLIAFVWAVVTVILPMAYVGYPLFAKDLCLLTIERFLFLLAITIPFDVRDLKIDREGGLVTLPAIMGLKQSLLVSALLLSLYLVITLCHYGFGNIVFVRTLCVFLVLILIQRINFSRPTYYYTGLLDGSMIFQSLLMHIMV